MINKKSNETIKEYKIRLCRNKDEYNLSFSDIANLLFQITGEKKCESVYRKWWKAYNEGYNDAEHILLDDNDKTLQLYESKRIAYEQEKIKYLDQRRSYNKSIRESSRFEQLKEILYNTIKSYEKVDLNPANIYDYGKNDLLIGLNDIHYGANIDNTWNKYNPEIAKDRLSLYLSNIFNIAKTHNAKNAYVCINGDIISGKIHKTIEVTNTENVLKQVTNVSELLSEFMYNLSKNFFHVYVSCVSGNHSRLESKFDSLKEERLDELIPWYLKAKLSNINNITILDNDIDNTFNVINIRGKNYVNVHGDYDNKDSLLKLINMINEPVYGVHFGHFHTNATDWVQGYKFLMSGSLQGLDSHCIQKRILGKAQQSVSVCNKNGVMCTYDVDLQN